MFAMPKWIAQVAVVLGLLCSTASGQASEWTVRKSSGEVWIAASGAQQVALTPEAVLKPGDQVRTGRNGRVLLVRGEESILVSPNSAIALPKTTGDGVTTTILQQRGSIVLEVEKRSEKHFEVETPYLVAVVKGTQFRVSVQQAGSTVDVLSGQVEVAELKTGKFALVGPGQSAKVAIAGANLGLSVSGKGTLDTIKHGAPRVPRMSPVAAPAEVRASTGSGGAVRIKSALGEVKLNVQQATKGLIRAANVANANSRASDDKGSASERHGRHASIGYDANGNGGGNGLGHGGGGSSSNGGGNGGVSGLGNGLGSGGGNGLGNGGGNGLGNGGGNGLGNGGGNGLGNGGGNGLGNGGGNGLGNGGGNGLGNGGGSGLGNAMGAGLPNGNAFGIGNGHGNGACKGKGKGASC
jgi:hypothetical protein